MPNKYSPVKNTHLEVRLITQRSLTALVMMGILALILILRLGFMQLAQHTLYTTLSKKNWLDLIPLEPTRGLIYDRNGLLLAENTAVFSLDIVPYKVASFPKMLADLAKIVALSDTDIAQFQHLLKQHRRFDELTLKLHLTEAEVARFYENQYRFPGAIVKARLMRHYPQGESFSHVLGYVGRINLDELKEIDTSNYSGSNYIGKAGIEKFYEDELHGAVGYQQAETDASGEPVRVLNQIHPIPGKNLYLTLDSHLQKAAEEALAGHRGAVIAIDPSTGQVLAMASVPNFDPNLFVEGIRNQDYQALQQSPDHPLYDRTVHGLYPFASTIKPFIALAGLNTGVVTAEDTIFDPGWFRLKNSTHYFHDWQHQGHGTVDLHKAIVSSCDTYFFHLASLLGIERIDAILQQFGFGKATDIDLDDELIGNIASPLWKKKVKGIAWYPGDTLNSGIGQGFMQTTPLQLAAGVATIANRGIRFTPYLVLAQQTPGKLWVKRKPTALPPVHLNSESWEAVITAMQDVFDSPEGTAHRFSQGLTYKIAAKTGTAQVYSQKVNRRESTLRANQDNMPEYLRDNSLIIAFAPVDKPKIAIAVVVENSHLAGTVARKVLDAYMISRTNNTTSSRGLSGRKQSLSRNCCQNSFRCLHDFQNK
ncbi:hypothetical protein AYO45_06390 [Gammaproteobacteria bacterium SCGC AG-212-F23]|nr:hypothetical protein AYO45_06390 [Gammaproteobacteria bacterium SCGC AG-212-F23]